MLQPRFLRILGYVTFAVIFATLGLLVGQSLHESRGGEDRTQVQKPPAKGDPTEEKANTVPIAYVGARIHTAAGPVIPRGVLLIQKGKILDVGTADTVLIPAEAKVVDLAGK